MRRHAISILMRDSYPALRARLSAAAGRIGSDLSQTDVEDAIQDAFLLLYDKWDKYENHENLAGFLYATAFHSLQNLHRVNMGRASANGAHGDMDYASMKAWEDEKSRNDDIENRDAMLEKIKASVSGEGFDFLLKYYRDNSTAREIAEQYGITEQAAWKRKERLIKRIKGSISNKMFTLIMSGIILPITLICEGDVQRETPPAAAAEPSASGGDRMPVLCKEDALAILGVLHDLAPGKLEDADLLLIDICNATLDARYIIAPNREDAKCAMREFKRRLKERKAESRLNGGAARRVSKRAIVAFALIACILLAAVAYSMGWLPWLFSMTRDVEQYVMSIQAGDMEQAKDDLSFRPTGLDGEFDAILEEYDIRIPLPTWVPEGAEYDSAYIYDDDSVTSIRAAFFKDEQTCAFISVTKYRGGEDEWRLGLEKDNVVYEELEHDGLKYIVYSNGEWMGSYCYAPPYTTRFSVRSSSTDEIIKMIESIPGRSKP